MTSGEIEFIDSYSWLGNHGDIARQFILTQLELEENRFCCFSCSLKLLNMFRVQILGFPCKLNYETGEAFAAGVVRLFHPPAVLWESVAVRWWTQPWGGVIHIYSGNCAAFAVCFGSLSICAVRLHTNQPCCSWLNLSRQHVSLHFSIHSAASVLCHIKDYWKSAFLLIY